MMWPPLSARGGREEVWLRARYRLVLLNTCKMVPLLSALCSPLIALRSLSLFFNIYTPCLWPQPSPPSPVPGLSALGARHF